MPFIASKVLELVAFIFTFKDEGSLTCRLGGDPGSVDIDNNECNEWLGDVKLLEEGLLFFSRRACVLAAN